MISLYQQTISGKGFDELGTVIPIVVSLVQETLRDIPYEVTEWNVVDVFGKRSLYGLRGISVKIHPFVHLSTDVVHGFLVGNARQVIMAILHDHADALFLFPLLSACVIGTVLFVKIRGDSKLYRLCLDKCLFFVGDDSGTGSGTDVGPGTDVASSSVFVTVLPAPLWLRQSFLSCRT